MQLLKIHFLWQYTWHYLLICASEGCTSGVGFPPVRSWLKHHWLLLYMYNDTYIHTHTYMNLHSFKNPDLHLAGSNSPCSQLLPENPSMQVQLYLQPSIPWHVALFQHGLDWHGFQIPVIRRKNMGLGSRQKLTRIKDLKKEENIAWLKAF